MIDSPFEVSRLLREHGLGDRELVSLPVPGGGHAFAVQAHAKSMLEDWEKLRGLVALTGRWPIFSNSYEGGDWKAAMRSSDPFSRFEFEGEYWRIDSQDVSPATVIARSLSIEASAVLERSHLQDMARFESYAAQFRTARSSGVPMRLPDEGMDAMLEGMRPKVFTAEKARYLEGARAGSDPGVLARAVYQDWFDVPDEHAFLLLLPDSRSWAVPAYLHWFGACAADSESVCAMLRHWQERHGAELVAHFGTMLQFVVANPPSDPSAAFDLAWEHDQMAGDTLARPGVEVGEHADYVALSRRWFLHSRP
jgi:hypothetical protein